MIEFLESRRLMSGNGELFVGLDANGALIVSGGAGANEINVDQVGERYLNANGQYVFDYVVSIDGAPRGTFVGINEIHIDGDNGADRIIYNGEVFADVDGGVGQDTIIINGTVVDGPGM